MTPTPTISDALAELRAADPVLGELAEAAFGWLGDHADVGAIGQARVQEFLWYALPRSFIVPPGEQAELFATMREALARVFERLGRDRLAAVCRSAPTVAVHDAYLRSEDEGVEAARAAAVSSGLEPPDVDGFAWGDVMGMAESAARDRVEAALEHAIVAGELVPGRRSWERDQQRVTAAVLDAPGDEPGAGSLRERVRAERVERWSHAAGPRLAVLRQSGADALVAPVDPPDGLADAFAHLAWFIRAADAGIRLTERGNLNRAFVQAAAVERGWQDMFTPYREWDVPMLGQVHEVARELRAVRRRGRVLHATARGRAVADDPVAAWRAVVELIAAGRGAEALAFEVLALMLIAGDGDTRLVTASEALAGVLAEAGYRWQDESPRTDAERAGELLHEWRWPLELLGMLSRWEQVRWPEYELGASSVGMATLRAVLHARATAPRR